MLTWSETASSGSLARRPATATEGGANIVEMLWNGVKREARLPPAIGNC